MAPKARGFSYIEQWFVGVQVPIVFALLEYGIILAIMRKKDNNTLINLGKKKWYLSEVIFKADVISFTTSIIYFGIFNFIYWQKALVQWKKNQDMLNSDQ